MRNRIPMVPGGTYHVYNRGNNRQEIFKETKNYYYFLRLAKKYICPIMEIYAYALLPDHFHFLVRVLEEEELAKHNIHSSRDISLKFGHFFNAYAKAFNKKYDQVSSLFQDRFQRKEIRDESHFLRKFYYIHWNPQKHNYVKDFKTWDFSSFKIYMSNKPTFLPRQEILESFGGKGNFIADHQIVIKKWQQERDRSKSQPQS
jgi:putative transposase